MKNKEIKENLTPRRVSGVKIKYATIMIAETMNDELERLREEDQMAVLDWLYELIDERYERLMSYKL